MKLQNLLPVLLNGICLKTKQVETFRELKADAWVAASTGPLYINADKGKYAIGLYEPIHPIDPRRWAPLGKYAYFLVLDKQSNDCRKTMNCMYIRSIESEEVVKLLPENREFL